MFEAAPMEQSVADMQAVLGHGCLTQRKPRKGVVMSALNALMVAIELATRKRDEARQLLRQRQQSRLPPRSKCTQQLQSYQAEMQQRWGAHEGAQLKT